MSDNQSIPIVTAEILAQSYSAIYDNGALDKPVLSESEKLERKNNTAILKANIVGLKYAWFKVTRRYDEKTDKTTYKSEVIYYDGGIKTPSGKKSRSVYGMGDSTWHTGDSSLNIPAAIHGNKTAMLETHFRALESFVGGINAAELLGTNHLATQLEAWAGMKQAESKYSGNI